MTKILYIEDNQDTAEAVKIILTNAGFIIETANSGKKGTALAKKGFDIFLLDIMLPDMSGWDIFATLKKEGTKAKFAFLSAIPVSGERMNELKKAGVSDYITKPFTKEDLVNRVKKIAER
ncbi:response regulator [Candidatus Pacearchaeota archaeon]|nr:response regulator [Candidatus Pacearchaeota archaeon]